MSNHKTSTPTLVSALRILAGEIQSDDGVASAAIAEGADRIEEFARDIAVIAAERDNLDAVSARQVERMLKAEQSERDARAEISQLKGALALGQENCDAEYDALREERDAALRTLEVRSANEKARADGYREECEQAQAEVAELRRDNERLDWLESRPSKYEWAVTLDHGCVFVTRNKTSGHGSVREAIDAAMKEADNG